jgi:DNA primase
MLDSPIDEIKSKLSITDVLSDYMQLKKAGTNFKAVCPFHSEKTPSFMVSPSKQIWHCFGCGLGGDIFEFIKQMENVEFAEALRILADRAGVVLKKPTVAQIQIGEKKDILYEINLQAAKYFAKVLWESNAGAEALAYLRNRGLTDPTIKNWMLGYAPDDFHYLENFLAKNFDKKDIELAGLIIKSDKGGYFDRFHDRVMFPIVNLHGQAVGFTGRLLHDKPDTGKYVNSPETPIYNKSQVIYGLFQGKNSIRKQDRAVVVEGNMDVITCHQAGFTQTVATSGTALTDQQLTILKRLTNNLIFAFDSDAAGSVATKRALELALNQGFNVKIADLGQAKDPDELIKRSIGLWEKTVEGAGNYLDFVLADLLKTQDPSTAEGIGKIESAIVPLINYLANPVIKAHYVRKIASTLNVPEKTIFDRLNSLKRPVISRPLEPVGQKKDRRQILEDQLLGLCLNTQTSDCLKDLDPADFTAKNSAVTSAMLQAEPKLAGIKQLHPELADHLELLSFSSKVEVDEQGLSPQEELARVSLEFKRLVFKHQLEKIIAQLSVAQSRHDQPTIEKLSRESVAISNKIANLR